MELTKTLLSYGLQQCKTDPCVFVKFEETQSKIEGIPTKVRKTATNRIRLRLHRRPFSRNGERTLAEISRLFIT